MDALLGIITFIALIAAAYFLVKWVVSKIKHTDSKHGIRNAIISVGVAFLAAFIGALAFPPKESQVAKKHDTSSSTVVSSSSERSSQKTTVSSKSAKSSHKSAKKVSSSSSSTKKTKAVKTSKSVKTNKPAKASSKKQPKAKKPSKKTYDFSKIKLGMTKSEIVKLIGKPDGDTSGTLSYGDDYLALNDKGKLFSGSPKAIQSQIDADNKRKKNAASDKANHLRISAKIFGQKDVETLQKYVGTAYSSTETNQGMAYGWKTDYGMLYRLDVTKTGITHVYKGGIGDSSTELYVGQTIKQKPKVYRYYN